MAATLIVYSLRVARLKCEVVHHMIGRQISGTTAREAFVTSATQTVMPAASINGRTVGDGKHGYTENG